MVVTTAVKFPTAVGLVPNVTVSEVAVAAMTVPIAPLLKTTVLLAAIGSNANPPIARLEELMAIGVALFETDGVTRATCKAGPLDFVLVVTDAVNSPTLVGRVESETVRVVAVAAVTLPAAPLLSDTELFPGVVSNPNPLMVSVAAPAA